MIRHVETGMIEISTTRLIEPKQNDVSRETKGPLSTAAKRNLRFSGFAANLLVAGPSPWGVPSGLAVMPDKRLFHVKHCPTERLNGPDLNSDSLSKFDCAV